MPDGDDKYVTLREFKLWADELQHSDATYRQSTEKRLSRLEAQNYLQIAMLGLSLLATAGVLLKQFLG